MGGVLTHRFLPEHGLLLFMAFDFHLLIAVIVKQTSLERQHSELHNDTKHAEKVDADYETQCV